MHRPSLLLCLALAACGDDGPPPWTAITPPQVHERDLGIAEDAAFAVEADLARNLLAGLRARDPALVARAFTPGARGRFPGRDGGTTVADAHLDVRVYTSGEALPLGREDLARRLLDHLRGWSRLARAECSLDRFWLDGQRATGRLELRLAGESSTGRRTDLRTLCLVELERVAGTWLLARMDLLEGTRLAGPPPRFRDVSRETGLHYGVSPENRAMLQAFADQHRTLALGGLTVLDWNGDQRPDVLGTRRGQSATLFLNDGAGGFTPQDLPMGPRESGSFLLVVDLEGDGRPELVGSQPLGYEGGRGWCGIWRRDSEAAPWTLDERALEFPNPVGLRRLAIQAIVPCDVNGDGRLDLFFAVYGSALSRREHYNTVEAHDGADNHLFIQQPDGSFLEESEARGIGGSQYTYVAQAFDFDDDGDMDLFEGNDFGPNVLWLNDGDGRFHADDKLGFGGVPAYTMGLSLGDFDNSGRWSLYVSNMSSKPGARIVPLASGLSDDMRAVVATIASGNMLYTRDPESGRWEERAADLHVNDGGWAWGCTFWDPDGDGDREILVTNGFTSHSDPSRPDWQSWYWRQVVADGGFLERGLLSQDVNGGRYRPSSFNGYERDRLYHQAGGTGARLFEAGWLYGLDGDHDGRCAVALDVDGDGDLDLALWTLQGLKLMLNTGAPTSFTRLHLRARGSHPLALGAVAEVTSGGRTQRALVQVTDGFQSQVPADLHFGLGGAEGIERIVVRWPSGTTQTWQAPPINSRLVLTEGQDVPEASPLPRWPETSAPRPAATPRLDLFLEGARGGSATLGGPGKVHVVRLQQNADPWPDLAALQARHPGVEWRVVQAPGTPLPTEDQGVTVLRADPTLLRDVFAAQPPTWPTTIVFDAEGIPRRTYRRVVSAAELNPVLDLLAPEEPSPELLVMGGRQALDEGRLPLARQLFSRALDLDDRRADACSGLGRSYMLTERPDLAEPAYARAVAIDPDYALGHHNLGIARLGLGRPIEAMGSFEASLALSGDRRPALTGLADAAYLARDMPRALDAWTRIRALDPTDPDALLNIAKLLGQLRRYPEAKLAYEALLALRPSHSEGRAGLRLVEGLIGDDH
jgi:ASPIC and UnbV/FG-GAP-like repeat/Tetratricopeptide repeat